MHTRICFCHTIKWAFKRANHRRNLYIFIRVVHTGKTVIFTRKWLIQILYKQKEQHIHMSFHERGQFIHSRTWVIHIQGAEWFIYTIKLNIHRVIHRGEQAIHARKWAIHTRKRNIHILGGSKWKEMRYSMR